MKVIDLVCSMELRQEKAVATIEHDGTTYFFCTEACRKQFEKEPNRYLRAEPEELTAD